jgi:hypothetical protein
MMLMPWVDKKFNVYKVWPIAKDDEIQSGVQQNQKESRLKRLRQLKHEEAVKKHGITN